MKSTVSAPSTKPPSPAVITAALGFFSLLKAASHRSWPEEYGRPGLDQARHGEGVPVGQPHAAMRLRAADRARLGRAVDPVMLLADVDPDAADRVVGTGRDLRLGVLGVGVPE